MFPLLMAEEHVSSTEEKTREVSKKSTSFSERRANNRTHNQDAKASDAVWKVPSTNSIHMHERVKNKEPNTSCVLLDMAQH